MELEEFCKNTNEEWHNQEGLIGKFSYDKEKRKHDDAVRDILALATINEHEKVFQKNKIKPREKAKNIFCCHQIHWP